jgi:pilus assembly protein CpaF
MSASINTLPVDTGNLIVLPGMEVIAPLIADATVSDILINGTSPVFVERMGKLEETGIQFATEKAVFDLGMAIAKAVGRELDPKRPLVDARLADGSRVNVVAPPLAVDGTSISIRKFPKSQFTLDNLVTQGSMSLQVAEFLKIIGHCRINTMISGGTGSGKTTLLNAISQYIDDGERVVTIEDAAELRLQKRHVVRLETKPPLSGEDASCAVHTRDLLKNALRMRPDRIIVGEVRGDEAYDMMQAMNTGHEGSLATLHANHPRDALTRLENMIGMASSQTTPRAVRGQISSALHLIIQISRMRDGVRRITFISEVVGMEGDIITMQDLIQFFPNGETPEGKMKGEWRWMGLTPRFIRRIAYWGEQERFCKIFNIPMMK